MILILANILEEERALAHLLWGSDNAQLPERTESIGETPMLNHLAILDSKDVDPHDRNRLACGRDGSERTLLGAMDIYKSHHFVPISEKVLHGNFRVWEGIEVHTEKLAWPQGKAGRHGMVDSVGGDELIKCRQVLLIDDLLIEPLNKSFVVIC